MRTVYILGAGASAQYSNEKGVHPPVTQDFLSRAYCLFSNQMLEAWNFIREFYRVKLAKDTLVSVNVEEVMSVLDLARRRGDRIAPGFTRGQIEVCYEQLLELVWNTLLTVFRGEPCAEHQRLAQAFCDHDTAISFNWDILIDNALIDTPVKTFTAYGFSPDEIEVWDGQYDRIDSAPAAGVKLLKLHGSMNWLRCPECSRMHVLKSKKATNELPSELLQCTRDEQRLERAIIPFNWFKDYASKPFAQLWRRALVALTEAERLVIVGYSLPPADFHARELFLKAAYANRRLRQIIMIDKVANDASSPAERFEKIFNLKIRASERFGDFKSYFDQLHVQA